MSVSNKLNSLRRNIKHSSIVMSILKSRNKRPIISFGLGVTEATIDLDTDIIVYQNSLYLDSYGLTLDTDLSVRKDSNYHFVITGNIVGTHEIRCFGKGVPNSNKLILNVI